MPPIRKGDGTPVTPKGISQIRTGDGRILFDGVALPDSDLYQKVVTRWSFTEGSGTNVEDSEGSLDADFTGLDWGSGGVGGFYGILDGSDDAADLGSDSRTAFNHFFNDNVGGIGGWVKPDDVELQAVIANGASTSDRVFICGFLDGDWFFRFGSTGVDIITGSPSADTWQAFVITFDGDEATLYDAEASDSSMSVVGSDSASTDSGDLQSHDVHIGTEPGEENRYYGGGLDEVWNADEHVTESEIQEWFDDTKELYD